MPAIVKKIRTCDSLDSVAEQILKEDVTADEPDEDVPFDEEYTINQPIEGERELARKIRTQRPDLRNRRLRLIYAGRLLTNDVFVFQHLAAVDERARRRDATKHDAAGPQHDTHNTWIHCNVGPEIQPGEEEEGDQEEGEVALAGHLCCG